MSMPKKKPGRPKSECRIRDARISGYLTREDADYVKRVAENLGFTSTSEMVTAIFERLCVGGFSALVFARLGWQFANLLPKEKRGGYFLPFRPLPPLLGAEPQPEELSEHLSELKDAVEKEVSRD